MRRAHIVASCMAPALVLAAENNAMNALAERYVRLVLAMGQHDADYVDAYYGPPEWRKEAEAEKPSLPEIDSRAAALLTTLAGAAPASDTEESLRLRHKYLTTQLEALRARAAMLQGRKLTFDEEARALYAVVPPQHAEAGFAKTVSELDKRLGSGRGPVLERFDAYRNRFVIPKDRLDGVFRAAIDGCRQRTIRHIELPEPESFVVEYVTGKSWGGYNWYQGNYRSIIQVNADLPIYIDRAVDLACHEGYPGHHVYNALLEKHLVRGRGWVEYAVYPLFSPQSLIAEGTANFGIDIAFAKRERLAFERDVLFPKAGLDPATAAEYYEVLALVDRLSYAVNEAARQYLDGRIDAADAAAWLQKYALYSKPRAEQRVRFIDQYRSYVINYNLGKDLVARYIDRRAGSDPVKRWDEFERLLSSPRLPSDLLFGSDARR